MAKSMHLGKPVIATNYSGNLDYMNSENSLLVNYTMTQLMEDAGSYERGTQWADPDIDHAANLMRWVYEHRVQANAIGARAASDVRQCLDPNKTVTQITQRLREFEQS